MPYGAGEGLAHLASFIAGVANGGADTAAPGTSPGIGQRLSAGVLSATEGYDRFVEQQNRLNAAGKAGQFYFKANPEALQELGVTPEETQNFGAKDWSALANSHIQRQSDKMALARIAEYGAIADQRKQQVQDDQTAGQFLQNYLTAPSPVADTPAARMNYAATNTPGMSGRVLPKIMDSLAKWQAASEPVNAEVAPKETTVAGRKTIYNPRTGNFQIVDDSLEPQPVLDEDGVLLGHNVPTGKGGFRFERVPKASAVRPTIPAGAKPVQVNGVDYFQDEDGNLYKAPTPAKQNKLGQLGALLGGANPPAGAGANARPAGTNAVTVGKYQVRY